MGIKFPSFIKNKKASDSNVENNLENKANSNVVFKPQQESESDAEENSVTESDTHPRYELMNIDENISDENLQELARKRPAIFPTAYHEIFFVITISLAQICSEFFVSGFTVVAPTVIKALHIPEGSATWPSSAFSLSIACTMFFFGRLADMHGGKLVCVFGFGWLAIWALICGFSQNELMLDITRAICGFGPAAFLPSSVMILGQIYRPGPRKNIIFSIYSACAAGGFFLGIFIAGISAQFISWRFFFFIGAAIALFTTVLAIIFVPNDRKERIDMNVKMDWWGAGLFSSGFLLIVYSITDSPRVSWSTPYIATLFSVGVVIVGAAFYAEYKVKDPLLPLSIFKAKEMIPVLSSMFLLFGVLGVFLLYASYYCTYILGTTPMQLVAWFVPMALGGCIIAVSGGLVLHKIPGRYLFYFSGVAWLISVLLFAIMKVNGSYWAYIFPSMICATLGVDLTFSVVTVFVTTSLTRRQQGLAGALVNTVLHLSIAICLGFAEIIYNELFKKGATPRHAYKMVFYYAVGLASAALVILVSFVKLHTAEADYTADEKLEMNSCKKEPSIVETNRNDIEV